MVLSDIGQCFFNKKDCLVIILSSTFLHTSSFLYHFSARLIFEAMKKPWFMARNLPRLIFDVDLYSKIYGRSLSDFQPWRWRRNVEGPVAKNVPTASRGKILTNHAFHIRLRYGSASCEYDERGHTFSTCAWKGRGVELKRTPCVQRGRSGFRHPSTYAKSRFLHVFFILFHMQSTFIIIWYLWRRLSLLFYYSFFLYGIIDWIFKNTLPVRNGRGVDR